MVVLIKILQFSSVGSFYVIMEYVSNGNLRRFLRKSRIVRGNTSKAESSVSNLSLSQLLNFAIGVAKAMVHISNAGVRKVGPHVLYKSNQASVNDIFRLESDLKACEMLIMSTHLFIKHVK